MRGRTAQKSATAAAPPPSGFRLSTTTLPERDRVAIFREVYGRMVMHVEFEPAPDCPLDVDIAASRLPGLDILSIRRSPMRVSRTKELIAEDGDDRAVLQIGDVESIHRRAGREVVRKAGDAMLLSNSGPGSIDFPETGRLLSLIFPRSALEPFVRGLDDCFARTVPGNSPALRLLMCYAELLQVEADPSLQRFAVGHVYDLVAAALAPARGAAEPANRSGGVCAARLAAIKADIAGRLDSGHLSVADAAARHRLSVRQIERLFEGEDVTFTQFVRDARLDHARRLLLNPRFDRLHIAEIAYESGFNDLSYFNRSFRARFGLAPGEMRERAPGGAPERG